MSCQTSSRLSFRDDITAQFVPATVSVFLSSTLLSTAPALVVAEQATEATASEAAAAIAAAAIIVGECSLHFCLQNLRADA